MIDAVIMSEEYQDEETINEIDKEEDSPNLCMTAASQSHDANCMYASRHYSISTSASAAMTDVSFEAMRGMLLSCLFVHELAVSHMSEALT